MVIAISKSTPTAQRRSNGRSYSAKRSSRMTSSHTRRGHASVRYRWCMTVCAVYGKTQLFYQHADSSRSTCSGLYRVNIYDTCTWHKLQSLVCTSITKLWLAINKKIQKRHCVKIIFQSLPKDAIWTISVSTATAIDNRRRRILAKEGKLLDGLLSTVHAGNQSFRSCNSIADQDHIKLEAQRALAYKCSLAIMILMYNFRSVEMRSAATKSLLLSESPDIQQSGLLRWQ